MVEFSYIHIPFCTQKCKYCSFVSFINHSLKEKYIKALLKEIKNNYKNEPQKTIYFGGGTPSLLEINEVEQIIKQFNIEKNAEITFEINPENASLEYLQNLKKLGINRISIGVQSFDDKDLKEIGRRHTANETIEAVKNSKRAGINNISIDLIYGLKNQTLKNWESNLEIANSLDIEHISTYGLKIEDDTYYGKFPPKNLPDEEKQAEMYKLAIEKLNNFELYEISNFAKNKTFQSKHNLNYWSLNPYYGFGISASGFCNNTRYTNTNIIKEYLKNPFKKREEIKLNKKSLLEEFIFLGFRKTEGINTEEIKNRFNIDFDSQYKQILQKYMNSGHILKTKNGYKLSTDGILISNYILCDFLM